MHIHNRRRTPPSRPFEDLCCVDLAVQSELTLLSTWRVGTS